MNIFLSVFFQLVVESSEDGEILQLVCPIGQVPPVGAGDGGDQLKPIVDHLAKVPTDVALKIQ